MLLPDDVKESDIYEPVLNFDDFRDAPAYHPSGIMDWTAHDPLKLNMINCTESDLLHGVL